jgi:hypothetical protein
MSEPDLGLYCVPTHEYWTDCTVHNEDGSVTTWRSVEFQERVEGHPAP